MQFNYLKWFGIAAALLSGWAQASYYSPPTVSVSTSFTSTGTYTVSWRTPSPHPYRLHETRIENDGRRIETETVYMGGVTSKTYSKPVTNVRYEYRVANVDVGGASSPVTVDVYNASYKPKSLIPVTKREYGCGPLYAPDYPRSSCGYRTIKYGTGYVFTGRDGVLNDPVVISQWFEMQGSTPSVHAFARRLDLSASNMFSTLLTDVAHDRDVVIYMYEDPTQSVLFSGDGLSILLQEINRLKGAAGRPNVVIGLSAGGVVARYALAKMESQNVSHDTSLYISYDAPHTGANITSELIRRLYDMDDHIDDACDDAKLFAGPFASCPSTGELGRTLKLIESPAARELLTWHAGSSQQNAFKTALSSLGLPKMTHNVAFSNGLPVGHNRGIPSNYFALTWSLDRPSPWTDKDYTVYLNRPGSLDNEAGSSGNPDFLLDAIQMLSRSSDRISVYPAPSVPRHTFIATRSAFAITSGTTPFHEAIASTQNGVHLGVIRTHVYKMLELIATYQ